MPKRKPAAKPSVPWEITADMFLTEQEVAELLKHVRTAEREATPDQHSRALVDRLIIEILLFSGLRNSELCQLRVIDTEVGHGQPHLCVADSAGRNVHLPRGLSRDIVEFVRGVRAEFVPAAEAPDDETQVLILNERGRPYDRTALYRRVVRVLTAAGLGDRASVQLLRHTYGYLAYLRSHGNLLFVQQQLGHSHPMVTAVYSQFVQFSYPDLANNVAGEAFDERPPSPDKSKLSVQPPSSRKTKR